MLPAIKIAIDEDAIPIFPRYRGDMGRRTYNIADPFVLKSAGHLLSNVGELQAEVHRHIENRAQKAVARGNSIARRMQGYLELMEKFVSNDFTDPSMDLEMLQQVFGLLRRANSAMHDAAKSLIRAGVLPLKELLRRFEAIDEELDAHLEDIKDAVEIQPHVHALEEALKNAEA